MRHLWIGLWLVPLSASLDAAEGEGRASALPKPPTEVRRKDDAPASQTRQKPSPLTEDPLAREKMGRDLWITKGVQGGAKTDDLWILQSPSAPPTPGARDSGARASDVQSDWRQRWSSAIDKADASRQTDAEDAQRLEYMREMEKFVFGEKQQRKPGEPLDSTWRRPLLSSDNKPTPLPNKTGFAQPFGTAPKTPDSDLPQMPSALPGFESPQPLDGIATPGTTDFPALTPNGGLPRLPGMTGIDAPGAAPGIFDNDPRKNPEVPGFHPAAPGALSPSPFGFQPRALDTPVTSGLHLPSDPLAPAAAVQAPMPAPRAHSTDSFTPRKW